jgi:hypothetical protein
MRDKHVTTRFARKGNHFFFAMDDDVGMTDAFSSKGKARNHDDGDNLPW